MTVSLCRTYILSHGGRTLSSRAPVQARFGLSDIEKMFGASQYSHARLEKIPSSSLK